jgi:oligoribonuclease NrnB/cAMP/cGMP phosphodiesterase (DHH superfamily)
MISANSLVKNQAIKIKLKGEVSMNTYIYYHKRDYDGKCSGAIAYKYYTQKGGKVTLVGIDYGEEKLLDRTFTKQDRVVMLDWSASNPPSQMKKIYDEAGQFIWIDHHGTAIKSILNTYPDITFEGYQKEGFAGCELTWLYFKENYSLSWNRDDLVSLPRLVYLLGRYDVWDEQNEEGWDKFLNFQLGFKLYGEMDPSNKIWDSLFFLEKELEEQIIEDGKKLSKYTTLQNAEQCKLTGFKTHLENYPYSIFALNTTNKSSITFESIKDDYDIFSAFTYNGKEWSVSLYSFNPNIINVGKICKELGGGGHPGAAGFTSKTYPFV